MAAYAAQDSYSGGFLLSPPASSVVSSSSGAHAKLPQPRESPLRSGGSKESTFIRYVDQQMLHIQRRFAKRTTPASNHLADIDRDKADSWGDVKGYSSMKEVCKDLEGLIDIVWVSGTPSLQVPYLIGIAMQAVSVIQSMPPAPKSLFRLLDKLDFAFASLLQGRDVESGERLPGFTGGRGVSGTEKVRIRSLVERTRVNVVEVLKKGEFDFEDAIDEVKIGEDGMDIDTDGELVLEGEDHVHNGQGDDEDTLDMQMARVYDRTVLELGDSLEAPNIGVITEERR